MNITEINPFIRFASITNFRPYSGFGYAADCRLFYVLGGKCRLDIGEANHMLLKESFVLICPGEKYRFSEFDNAEVAVINFDFDQSRARVRHTYKISEKPQGKSVHFKDFSGFEEPVVIHNMPGVEAKIREIAEEYEKRRLFYRERASGLMKILICDVVRYLSTRQNSSGEKIDMILDYIAANLSGKLDNAELGAKFGYHPYYLSRLVHLHTGKTLKQYIITLRIGEAKKLLKSTDLSLAEIARRTGFENAAYFSNCFHARTKISPGEYRRGNNDFI